MTTHFCWNQPKKTKSEFCIKIWTENFVQNSLNFVQNSLNFVQNSDFDAKFRFLFIFFFFSLIHVVFQVSLQLFRCTPQMCCLIGQNKLFSCMQRGCVELETWDITMYLRRLSLGCGEMLSSRLHFTSSDALQTCVVWLKRRHSSLGMCWVADMRHHLHFGRLSLGCGANHLPKGPSNKHKTTYIQHHQEVLGSSWPIREPPQQRMPNSCQQMCAYHAWIMIGKKGACVQSMKWEDTDR